MKPALPLAARLLPALLAFSLLPTLSATSIWINEFHYDNSGTDLDEFVEIAGTAGANLSGYSVLLYNGNGGASYGSIALSGTLPNQSNGFGALAFYKSSIQNGSPGGDGLALIDSSNAVLQFLSYEGSFAASGGAASGRTSEDIGVFESSSTPVGHSLQLVGHGSTYGAFTWTGPVNSSPGELNAKQTFEPVPDSGSALSLGAISLVGLVAFRRLQKRSAR